MAKFTIVKQKELELINTLNRIKKDNAFIVLEEFNEYSTICQYSKKFDSFKIISVKTENLKEEENFSKPF